MAEDRGRSQREISTQDEYQSSSICRITTPSGERGGVGCVCDAKEARCGGQDTARSYTRPSRWAASFLIRFLLANPNAVVGKTGCCGDDKVKNEAAMPFVLTAGAGISQFANGVLGRGGRKTPLTCIISWPLPNALRGVGCVGWKRPLCSSGCLARGER